MYIYIYIYEGLSETGRDLRLLQSEAADVGWHYFTPNLPTNIVDFGGFDSSIILFSRGGILMSIGDFPESLSQAMLVGVMLVGRLGLTLLV